MGEHGPVVPDRLPVGRDLRRLPGRLRPVPQHGLDVASLAGVVDQPGEVDLAFGGAGQHVQDPPVELPAGQGRQRALDRLAEELVTEPDRLGADDQQPGRHADLDRRRRRAQRLLEQPQLGPGRDHGGQAHDLLGVRRQAAEAGQHQVADGHGDAGVRGGQHLGDQQWVAAGEGAQPGGRAAGSPGQLGHGRLGQRFQPQPPHRLRRQPADDRPERVVDAELVVAVRDDQQRPGPLHPPAQEHQQVQGRLVGPVGVLHDHDLGPGSVVELVEERGEELLTGAPSRQQVGQAPAGLPPEVVQRPERPRREQRIAGPDQEPRVPRVPLGEPPDKRRLADPRLTGHQHDPAAHGQHAGQLIQEEVRSSSSMTRRR